MSMNCGQNAAALDRIRKDLKEIRYYYTHKETFNLAAQNGVNSSVTMKVRQYNRIVESAPPILFDLYVSLYMGDQLQQAFADERGLTPNYVKDLHNKLCLFFQQALNKTGGI